MPLVWSIAAAPATEVAAAAVRQAQDLAELLSQRSPGTRTAAELTKTKHARTAARLRTVPKVAAPTGHAPPPTADTPAELTSVLQSPLVPVGLLAPGGPSPITPPPSLGAIFAANPGTPGFTPPGGGGGRVSFPTTQPRVEVPALSAVPEPGTWAMMLMGFALIGWRVRRYRRTSRKLTA
jgi:hypothetical protein